MIAKKANHTLSRAPRRLILRALWLGGVGMVIVGSLLPDSSPAMQAFVSLEVDDKLQHGIAYAGLGFLPTLHEKPQTLLMIALAMVAMGVALEFGQRLVAGRYFDIGDMVADAVGVAAGIILGFIPRLWVRPRHVIPSER